MSLPDRLLQSILDEIAAFPIKDISRAFEELSQFYRTPEGSKAPILKTELHRMAYLCVRLPATYAVLERVFSEIAEQQPDLTIQTVLDLGSGPGTTLWALLEVFSSLKHVTLVEQDLNMIQIGKKLCGQTAIPSTWVHSDMLKCAKEKTADLTVLSYSLGECDQSYMHTLIESVWEHVGETLVVVEPGTPRGFETIHAVREKLIALEANLIAPCPHKSACPMKMAGDWCHFSQRLPRTRIHRLVKDASLGYEDEKFSYVVASKQKGRLYPARILRHPQIREGHVQLVLCTEPGLQEPIISRRDKELYRKARKAEWGDVFDWQES